MNEHVVKGRVIDAKSRRPIEGLRVEAWDRDLLFHDLLGSATTDRDGTFHIAFDAGSFQEAFLDRSPDLFFKVFRADRLFASTESSVLWNVREAERSIEIVLSTGHGTDPAPRPELGHLAKGLGLGKKAQKKLEDAGVTHVADLLTPEGLAAARTLDLPHEERRRILGAAKFALGGGNADLAARIAKAGVTSFSRLAGLTLSGLEASLGTLSAEDRVAANRLIARAQLVQGATMSASVQYRRSTSKDAAWYHSADAKEFIPTTLDLSDFDLGLAAGDCNDCDSCHNAFSPLAYLYDLLDYIYPQQNAGGLNAPHLTVGHMEEVILQPIAALTCADIDAPVAQARIGLEVLEKHLGPVVDLSGYRRWKDEFALLAAVLRVVAALPQNDPLLATAPRNLAELDVVIDHVRQAYAARVADTPQSDIDIEAQFDRLLVTYRDRLIRRTGKTVSELERVLFIDLRAAAGQRTTRVTQVIESLQSFILSIQTGEVLTNARPDIAGLMEGVTPHLLNRPRWRWLETYATWCAATYVLAYPENVVSPPILRQPMTPGFARAAAGLMAGQSVDTVLKDFEEYLDRVTGYWLLGVVMIDRKICLFGKFNQHFGMNVTSIDGYHPTWYPRWEGWQEIDAWKERGTPTGVGVRTDSAGKQRIVIEATVASQRKQFFLSVDGATIETVENVSDLSNPYDVVIDNGDVAVRHGAQTYNLEVSWDDPDAEGEWVTEAVVVGYDDPSPYTAAVYLVCRTAAGTVFGRTVLLEPHVDFVSPLDPTLPADHTVHTLKIDGDWDRISTAIGRVREEMENVQPYSSSTRLHARMRQIYTEERYLHFPLMAAYFLARSGDYEGANTWYRALYDPFRPEEWRQGFPFEAYVTRPFERDDFWQLDVLNPYLNAQKWQGAQLRHVILRSVENLIAWADHEYSLVTPESLNRARELYRLAERVLAAPDLGGTCKATGRELKVDVLNSPEGGLSPSRKEVRGAISPLDGIADRNAVNQALVKVRSARRDSRTVEEFLSRTRSIVLDAQAQDLARRQKITVGDGYAAREGFIDDFENEVIAYRGIDLTGDPIGDMTGAGFGGTGGGLGGPAGGPAGGPGGYGTPGFPVGGSQDWGGPTLDPKVPGKLEPGGVTVTTGTEPRHGFMVYCIPANPLLRAYSAHIQNNLTKLAAGRNIAGDELPRAGQIVTSSGGTSTPDITRQGSVEMGEPSRYRYGFLVEKARQQALYAQQLGAALLQAIERQDDQGYARLLATNSLQLADATVTLKSLMQQESHHASDVAEKQRASATVRSDFYAHQMDESLGSGLSGFEITGLGLMAVSGILQMAAAAAYMASVAPAAYAAAMGTTAAAAGAGASITGIGTIPGLAALGGGGVALAAAAAAGGPLAGSGLQAAGGAAGTFGSFFLTIAGYDRRWREWKLQSDLAAIDQAVGDLQIQVAEDHIAIADQDHEIATLQRVHAERVIDFLKGKFSNEELYAWMREVLLDQYRTVLRLATSTALLAQHAVRFERQRIDPCIQNDYLVADLGRLAAQSLTQSQKDMGLLGAERLLTDLTALDSYKLQTDRRLLQLSKTISLSRVLPAELIELRASGRATFNTLLDWFDLDFPGHYLRLIKSVRVTVVALTPTTEGIRAMLHNNGVSSVVVPEADGTFVKKQAVRNFDEAIALDGALSETGMFVLDYNDPMFLPFEGLGVETGWTLELPRAANRFDFETIADVLLTIEYTALQDRGYRKEVAGRLGSATHDALFDVRTVFPDQWYHLKNPPANGAVHEVALSIAPGFFPPNLSNDAANPLLFKHLTLVLVGTFDDGEAARLRAGVGLVRETQLFADQTFVADGSLAGLTKDVLGAPTRGTRYICLSSRVAPNATSPAVGAWDRLAHTVPTGEWKIVAKRDLLARPTTGGEALIDKVDGVYLVLTVGGTLTWPEEWFLPGA